MGLYQRGVAGLTVDAGDGVVIVEAGVGVLVL
jgi:hypothetical protein